MLIVDGDDEFDQDIFALRNNFRTEYEQLLKAYTKGHLCDGFNQECDNNTNKRKLYLRAQHYTILTKVVNKTIRAHLLQFRNKLLSAQSAFKEVNSFPFFCII